MSSLDHWAGPYTHTHTVTTPDVHRQSRNTCQRCRERCDQGLSLKPQQSGYFCESQGLSSLMEVRICIVSSYTIITKGKDPTLPPMKVKTIANLLHKFFINQVPGVSLKVHGLLLSTAVLRKNIICSFSYRNLVHHDG